MEFNEVNFDLVRDYLSSHPIRRWKNLRKLVNLDEIHTTSENRYDLLEPWIQWASVHTGKSANEHQVYRLGDIQQYEGKQIFEYLEESDIKVGCISVMNAENRLQNPSYFIPDPWTVTQTDGSFFSEKIYHALHQSVNDNSSGKLTKKTIFYLLVSLIAKTNIRNWPLYINLALKAARGQKWCKALFLDLFISDLHINLYKSKKPNFTSVFFNAFAHIQHHYFFNSQYYKGSQHNPDWYIRRARDPFLDALDVYDRILKDHFTTFEKGELVTTTGLRQVPYDQTKYYYRLLDHKTFLEKVGVDNFVVHPRMTRDFLIEFHSVKDCENAKYLLQNLSINGKNIFEEIEDRESSLFVTLTYPKFISDFDQIETSKDLNLKAIDHVVFVAIKNGMHDSKGYCFTTAPNNDFKNMDRNHVKSLFSYFQKRLLSNEDCSIN